MSAWERQLARARERQQQRAPMVVAYSSERFTAEQAAVTATRVAGCTCSPEVVVDGLRATVRHDPWCALLRRSDLS